MTTRPFDLVALDMAGTTVDEGGIVYEVLGDSVTALVGASVPVEVLERWKGTSKREAMVGILTEMGEDAGPGRVDDLHDDFEVRLAAAYRSTPPKPVTGVPEMFSTLRSEGVRVALQTGYTASIADAVLAGLGWSVGGEVDALITSDGVPASRPAPYLVFRCMEATAVTDVRRVLVAGDTPNDILAGRNAGAGFVVGVLTGSFDEPALRPHDPTHVVESLPDVLAL